MDNNHGNPRRSKQGQKVYFVGDLREKLNRKRAEQNQEVCIYKVAHYKSFKHKFILLYVFLLAKLLSSLVLILFQSTNYAPPPDPRYNFLKDPARDSQADVKENKKQPNQNWHRSNPRQFKVFDTFLLKFYIFCFLILRNNGMNHIINPITKIKPM